MRFRAAIFQNEIVLLLCRDAAVHDGSERCNSRLLDCDIMFGFKSSIFMSKAPLCIEAKPLRNL